MVSWHAHVAVARCLINQLATQLLAYPYTRWSKGYCVGILMLSRLKKGGSSWYKTAIFTRQRMTITSNQRWAATEANCNTFHANCRTDLLLDLTTNNHCQPYLHSRYFRTCWWGTPWGLVHQLAFLQLACCLLQYSTMEHLSLDHSWPWLYFCCADVVQPYWSFKWAGSHAYNDLDTCWRPFFMVLRHCCLKCLYIHTVTMQSLAWIA